jgi:hypothetical protein
MWNGRTTRPLVREQKSTNKTENSGNTQWDLEFAFEGSASLMRITRWSVNPVGVSGDLEMFTPEVHSGGSGGGRTTPDGVVRGPHVRNDAKGMGVGVDELVRGRNYFLWWHG